MSRRHLPPARQRVVEPRQPYRNLQTYTVGEGSIPPETLRIRIRPLVGIGWVHTVGRRHASAANLPVSELSVGWYWLDIPRRVGACPHRQPAAFEFVRWLMLVGFTP